MKKVKSLDQYILDLYVNTHQSGIATRIKHDVYASSVINAFKKENNISSSKYQELLYLYVNNKKETPKCGCGNLLRFISINKGYTDYCSNKCSAFEENRIRKGKEKGFGLSNPKAKQNAKNTNLKKYGVENPGQITSHREYMKTNNPAKLDTSKQKIKQTNLRRYGVENPMQSADIKSKLKENIKVKYNRNNPAQSKYSDDTYIVLNDKDLLLDYWKKYSFVDMQNSLDVSQRTLLTYLNYHDIRKPNEYTQEKQIKEFLESLGVSNIITNTRKVISPLELDIYLPDYQLAIEHCGFYYHSQITGNKAPSYHLNKLRQCRKKEIQLVQIFEDEWTLNRSVCEQRLKNKLNKGEKGIGARQLLVTDNVDRDKVIQFLKNYHIQGSSNFSISISAFHDKELVGVMTFLKCGKKWKIARYCTNGKIYPGLASKLWSYFITKFKPTCVETFCDLRWGTGEVYTNLGFKEVSETKPCYWYFHRKKDRLRKYHRSFFQRHQLKNFAEYDESLSEWEIMQSAGYDRIFDCGNKKFVWEK